MIFPVWGRPTTLDVIGVAMSAGVTFFVERDISCLHILVCIYAFCIFPVCVVVVHGVT